MVYYKFIHFLWSDELKFQGPIVEMINNSNGVFNPSDHLFLTPSRMVKDFFARYSNVCLFDYDGRNMAEVINYYCGFADWIISHGMANHVYSIKRKNLKKIVWRTWGGSRQKAQWDKCHIVKSIIGQCQNIAYYFYYRYSYGCSPVIGIANTVDVIDLEQWNWHKNSKLFYLNYGALEFDHILNSIKIEKKRKEEPINFLVGHQGVQGEHHVDLVRRLLSYDGESFNIFLPLSYGDQNYISEVKESLKTLNDARIHVMDKLIPIYDYMNFLSKIDVALIDEKSSMALGNICLLLCFRKKIILNKDGVLKKAFDKEGLPCGTCDRVGVMPYSELISPVKYNEPLESDIAYQPYEKQMRDWKEMFNYLDGLKKNG